MHAFLRSAFIGLLPAFFLSVFLNDAVGEEQFQVTLRFQQPADDSGERFHRLTEPRNLRGDATAVIVCDMWDSHHGYHAALRTAELGEPINGFVTEARNRGAIVIHAPSGCMEPYAEHPARRRAVAAPKAEQFPEDIAKWCHQIPAEEQAVYPIDQSAGGEDDSDEEKAAWQAVLKREGRDVRHPWRRQIDSIEIDASKDFISDDGKEIWSILTAAGVENVILVGVHTNMCVLGRPFGLRRMVSAGMNTLLVRDLTDTMYDPRAWPYVSHFTGTDLIIDHIERHVCPTITSDQITGGTPFRFAADRRPDVVIVIAEDEYRTEQTLPKWAMEKLGKDYRVSYCFGEADPRGDIVGLEALENADLMLVSVRRRGLRPESLAHVRRFVAAGKPVVGIRTSSHAFALRGEAPDGVAQWPEFDAEVFGGNYHNHYPNSLQCIVTVAEDVPEKYADLVAPFRDEPFKSGGSLYRTSPLAANTQLLLLGSVPDQPAEPAAWTFRRADGGRSFYTSLGHVDDFAQPEFQELLATAVESLIGAESAEQSKP